MTSPIPEKYIVPITENEIKTNLTDFKDAKITNIFSRLYHLYHKNVAAITVTSGNRTTTIYLKKDVLNRASEQESPFAYKEKIKQIISSVQQKKSIEDNFKIISNKILNPLDEKGNKQKTPNPEGQIQLTQPEFNALNQYLLQKSNAEATDSYTVILNKIPKEGNYLVSRRDLLDAYEFPEGKIANPAVNDIRTLQKNMRIDFLKKEIESIRIYISIKSIKDKTGNTIDYKLISDAINNINSNTDTKLVNSLYTNYLNYINKNLR